MTRIAAKSRVRAVLFNVALLAAGGLSGLAGAEILVRIFAPHAREYVMPAGMFMLDNHLGWQLRPRSVGTHRSRYFTAEYRVNGAGCRDVERTPANRGDAQRILLYGDSQVYGWGLAQEQRFSSLLEARLPRTEIWNCAVPGYGLDQQVLSYERTGAAAHAHDVVLWVTPQTLMRTRYGHIYQKPKPRFTADSAGALTLHAVAPRRKSMRDVAYRVFSRFYLPYFIERQLAAAREGATSTEPSGANGEEGVDALAYGLLRRARDTAVARGNRMTILAAHTVEARAQLRALATELGVRYLEIVFPDSDAAALTFGPHDPHWNAQANARVADMLAPTLTQ